MDDSYRIKEVDPFDDDIRHELTVMHKMTLPECVLPDFDEGWWWLVYDEKGVTVGFAGLTISNQWTNVGYLCRCGVLSGHRGHGIQKKLIRVREKTARAMGLEWMVTDTCDAIASTNNLVSAGYRFFRPSDPWSLKSALYLQKKLI